MIDINSLTVETILEDDIFQEVLIQEDEVVKAKLILALTARAKELMVKTKFETMLKAHKNAIKKAEVVQPTRYEPSEYCFMTNFDKYERMWCGNWIANENGIRTTNQLGIEIIACYHPILPIKRLINAETGKEKIVLAYKKGGVWKDIKVDKGVIASAQKITQLAEWGISVTSETSRHLVKFLSDVENMNLDKIETKVSTGKLGWLKGKFIPYYEDVVFDAEARFQDAFDSIKPWGSYEKWLELVKDIRKSDRYEPKIYLVASFASVLVEQLNALPFILNLWGETGKGKTVALMLATSVWANPGEKKYMADPKSTPVALELRMDFLNNLPMMIDDMAQIKAVKDRQGTDYSDFIYMLCSGKGKDRSNVTLGLNKPTSWNNIILTNGEHTMVTETMQGGAVNRIIDVEMADGYIFPNGNEVVGVLMENYGHAGKLFIDIINEVGIEEIRTIQKKALDAIKKRASELGVEKEEKQTLPMSILLTADYLINKYIFQDDNRLDFKWCVDLLKNKGEVSENDRAYEFIQSEIAMNMYKFVPSDPVQGTYKGDVWGCLKDGYAIINTNAFEQMCKKGNFSSRSFLNWAKKKELLDCQDGRTKKQRYVNGAKGWYVCLKCPVANIGSEEDEKESEFVEISEEERKNLPFA